MTTTSESTNSATALRIASLLIFNESEGTPTTAWIFWPAEGPASSIRWRMISLTASSLRLIPSLMMPFWSGRHASTDSRYSSTSLPKRTGLPTTCAAMKSFGQPT